MTLHIKLDITDSSKEYLSLLDQTLFSLLVNKCLIMGNGYLFLDKVNYFDIEISNTLKGYIMKESALFQLLLLNSQSEVNIESIKTEDIDLGLMR